MNQAQSFWRLLTFLRPFWRRIALSVLLSAVTVMSGVGLMMTSAWMISTAGLQVGIEMLGVAPTGVRFFGISRAVFRYLERLVSHDVTFQLLADLRVWFYEHIEPLAPAKLSQYRSGDLMARVVSDVEELQNFFIRVVAPPMTALLIVIGMTFLFLAFDATATLILFVFMFITSTTLPYFAWWRGRKYGQTLVEQRARLHASLIDAIQGLADSTAYGHTDALLAEIQQTSTHLSQQEMNMARLDGLQTGLSVFLLNFAALAVLMVAIPHVDGVYLASLVLGTIAAFEALTPLTVAAQHLSTELTSAQRLFEIIDSQVPITEADHPAPMPTDLTLQIKNLTFRYAPHLAPVFKDFTLNIAMGEHIAIVGESGAGKSSLVNVLLRFWDYDGGEITLGGVDLRQLSTDSIHDCFGVMSQRTHLFNITILENIRLARAEASDDDVMLAAQQAQIHDFIASLPQGYDTYVGEDGVLLSDGQRQRIALARIILKDAPIWILDEATANLDARTEATIMTTLGELAKHHTVLLITHRIPPQFHIERVIRIDD